MSAISQLPAVTAAGTDRIPLARLSGTDVYTAGTISAAASDNSLNDSAASFPAWMVPGLRINIAAFTGDTDNNHDSAVIVSYSAAKVVLGADTPLVDDAAGESVTITAWETVRGTAQAVAATIANDAVTNAKLANVATRTIKGRVTASTGDPEDLTYNQVRALLQTKQVLTDGATISWDADAGVNARVVLGGNRTLANPTNLVDGDVLNLRAVQSTGGHTLGYGSKYKWAGGVAPVLSTAAGAIDFLSFQYDATDDTLVGVCSKAFA
jgi:hypothetical protein